MFLTLILLWSEKKVYKVDLSTMEVERCDAFGESIPSARGGHASVLVRSQVYVFGGEETNTKKLRNDAPHSPSIAGLGQRHQDVQLPFARRLAHRGAAAPALV